LGCIKTSLGGIIDALNEGFDMSVAQPVGLSAVPAFKADEYENTLAALFWKVGQTVFSRWGVGLVALTVFGGACLGVVGGAGAAVVSVAILGYRSYSEWRIDQVPAYWQLSDAVKGNRFTKVETLLEYWDSFGLNKKAMLPLLLEAFDKARETDQCHSCIYDLILTKIKETPLSIQDPEVQAFFIKTARRDDWRGVNFFADAFGQLPENLQSECIELAVRMDKAFFNVICLSKPAMGGLKSLSIVLGRGKSPSRFSDTLSKAAHQNNEIVVNYILQTGQVKDKNDLQNALDSASDGPEWKSVRENILDYASKKGIILVP
jgi:hypothetical protein